MQYFRWFFIPTQRWVLYDCVYARIYKCFYINYFVSQMKWRSINNLLCNIISTFLSVFNLHFGQLAYSRNSSDWNIFLEWVSIKITGLKRKQTMFAFCYANFNFKYRSLQFDTIYVFIISMINMDTACWARVRISSVQ